MRSIEMKFKANGDDEAFAVTVERQASAGWVGDVNTRSYFAKDFVQNFLLEPGERLVIEPWGATVEMVFDKNQNAVMPKTAFDSQPDEATKQKMEEDRQQELRDIESGRLKVNRVADRAAEQARDKAIQEQLEQQNEKKEPNIPPAAPVVSPAQATHPSGGMAVTVPATGGQSSKDVKK